MKVESLKGAQIKELTEVNIDPQHPERVTFIGAGLEEEDITNFVQFLVEHWDQFVWSHEDMTGVLLKVITYSFHVNPSFKPIV